MGREPFLMIVIGRKGVGKTVATMKHLRKYVKGDPASQTPARRVLIFDTNNEYSDKEKYPDVKGLAAKDVTVFSAHPNIEIRRIPPFLPNGDEMTPDQKAMTVDYLLKNYRNGCLLLEDINSYIGDYMPTDVVGVILSQRHKGIDTILHYHSFGRVQKKIWPHVNMIRMHRAMDSVLRSINKYPDKEAIFCIAENIVNTQYENGNIYFYLHIDNDHEVIHANVQWSEKERAVLKYISQNQSSTITPLMNMKDGTGKKMYTYQAATEQVKKDLLNTYFPKSENPNNKKEERPPAPAPSPVTGPSPEPPPVAPPHPAPLRK